MDKKETKKGYKIHSLQMVTGWLTFILNWLSTKNNTEQHQYTIVQATRTLKLTFRLLKKQKLLNQMLFIVLCL